MTVLQNLFVNLQPGDTLEWTMNTEGNERTAKVKNPFKQIPLSRNVKSVQTPEWLVYARPKIFRKKFGQDLALYAMKGQCLSPIG